MCGVPWHSASGYIARLVKQGFRVALCEQMEDPRLAKGVVKREVVRVITPATQLEAQALDAAESSYVLALDPGPQSLGAAWLEPTTGEFFVVEWEGPGRWDRLRDEIGATRPREILLRRGLELPAFLTDPAQPEAAIPRSEADDRSFEPGERPPRAARPLRRWRTSRPSDASPFRARSGRPGRPPPLPARDPEARGHARDRPRDPRARGRDGRGRAEPPEPGARGEPHRRLAPRHAPRRPRPDEDGHGRSRAPRLDPPAAPRARANTGPAGRGGGAGLPHPGARRDCARASRASRTSTASSDA